MGPGMFSATLLEYGTDAQKQRHLPSIVTGELRWCQGYSEPNAGSDLASLQTKLEDTGDRLGRSTARKSGPPSSARFTQRLVLLPGPLRHQGQEARGISFVLINMRQPGRSRARPIKLISSASGQFCETFFTDARVEKDDMVGPVQWRLDRR